MTFRSGHQNFIEEPDGVPPLRRRIAINAGCATCDSLGSHDFAPPHDASARCESGKRNHCACDICF